MFSKISYGHTRLIGVIGEVIIAAQTVYITLKIVLYERILTTTLDIPWPILSNESW
jgi:hypothetical protein